MSCGRGSLLWSIFWRATGRALVEYMETEYVWSVYMHNLFYVQFFFPCSMILFDRVHQNVFENAACVSFPQSIRNARLCMCKYMGVQINCILWHHNNAYNKIKCQRIPCCKIELYTCDIGRNLGRNLKVSIKRKKTTTGKKVLKGILARIFLLGIWWGYCCVFRTSTVRQRSSF